MSQRSRLERPDNRRHEIALQEGSVSSATSEACLVSKRVGLARRECAKRERMEDAISRATSPEAGAGIDVGDSARCLFLGYLP